MTTELTELRNVARENPEKVKRRVQKMYDSLGSLEAVAKQLNCSKYAARQFLAELEIEMKAANERRVSDLCQVTEKEWSSTSDVQLAERYGCSVWNVRRYRHRRGLYKRSRTKRSIGSSEESSG